MNFIFYSRLEYEKGFDLLVRSLQSFEKLPGNFFIFSDGSMRKNLFDAFGENSDFVDCSKWSEEGILSIIEKCPHLHPLAKGEGIKNYPAFQAPLLHRRGINSPRPLGEGLGVRALDSHFAETPKIYFFSWQSKERIIDRFLAISHFSLMPSRFLETFGLVALESLSKWVPVIGFKKWGLVPFIGDELSIEFASTDDENVKNIATKIREVSEKYSPLPTLGNELPPVFDHPPQWGGQRAKRVVGGAYWHHLSENSKQIAARYSESRWIEEVKTFLPQDAKKILLVSDYISLLGGIETHVATIAEALKKNGYEVELFGWALKKDRLTKIKRLLGLVVSCFNLPYALKLREKISPPISPSIMKDTPDVVWLHSVSRFLGPLVVREAVNSGKFTCITYHDLGMWAPFPSQMEREEDVPKRWDLGSFFSVVRTFNVITHTAMFFKFIQLSILRKYVQQVDFHLVPSDFLRKYVRDITEIPDERIVILEHFQK